MNQFNALFILLLIFSSKDKSWSQHIKIEKTDEHPFLIDHGRVAKSYNEKGVIVDSIRLSSHTGAASGINLFEDKKKIIIIDVNGMWYCISKKTGQFIDGYWGWQTPLPEDYLGTFSYDRLTRRYTLNKTEITKENVYQLKDPTDYSRRFIKEKKYPSNRRSEALAKPKKSE